MQKPKPFHVMFLTAVIVVFLLLSISGLTVAMSGRPGVEQRPDLLVIDIPAVEGQDKMAGVSFLHGPHSEAVTDDCSVCHMTDGSRTIFKFKRLSDPTGEALMNLFHEACTACHVERKQNGLKTGPEAGECRVCHNTRPIWTPGQQKVRFDRSLHYRHEKTTGIESVPGQGKDKCGACHHQYNPKTLDIYYEKGREGACTYCHKQVEIDKIRSIRRASHDSCVTCHSRLRKKDVAAGPITCAACHAGNAFSDIEPLTDVPRLERNQPDVLFISGWGAMNLTPAELENREKQYMKVVPFDHRSHEKAVVSCKTCHHESLDKCGRCHTPEGSENGGYIRLDQAMHDQKSGHSCRGCHGRQNTTRQECAGCHFPMAEKIFSDQACAKCHTTAVPAVKLANMDTADQQKMARLVLDGLSVMLNPVPDEKIPDKVTIDVIAKEYEPSQFPHRKIVKSIMERIEDSEMARIFHGDGRVICSGCHHNSPLSDEPPRCASCHGRSTFTRDGRPGLKGAYHGQCITCHQKMNIKAVAATDCTKCHQEKSP